MTIELSELVALVEQVRARSKTSHTVALLAQALGRARGREAERLASWLTGAPPQGRIGIGWRALQAARGDDRGPGRGRAVDAARTRRAVRRAGARRGRGLGRAALALRADGRPLPFQVSLRRLGPHARRRGPARRAALSCFFFDCLYLEGEGDTLDAVRARFDRRRAREAPARVALW